MQHGPSPAAAVAAALAARAEEVCRRYLPHGRRQGRYWICGDLDGARGRSLFVRLAPPGTPGKFTDAATGEHGDLLDLIRHRSRAPTLRAALDEARAFLALPSLSRTAFRGPRTRPTTETQAARRLWRRCRAVDGSHAERYLLARGLSRCRFAALRFHPALRYREGSSVRRFPALVAAVTAGDGRIFGVQRTWLDPRSPAKADVAAPRKALGRVYGLAVRFGVPSDDAALVVGEGIETVLSLVTAVPEITRGRGALRREPRRVRASARPRPAGDRPRQRRGRHARGRTPRPALRAGARRRHGDRACRQRLQRRPCRFRRGGAPRPLRAAVRSRRVPPIPCRGRKRRARARASRPGGRRESMSAVINLRHEPKLREAFKFAHVVNNTVLVDRRTKWGNPFRIGPGQDAAQAVAHYRVHLWQRIRAGEVALEDLAELDGCWLACWCVGSHACHAEVLARAAAWASHVLAERDARQADGGAS